MAGFLKRLSAERADRRFLSALRSVQADKGEMAKLSPERRDYVNYQIEAFTWWLSNRHEYDIGEDPPGSWEQPRDRILALWAKTQPPGVQARVEDAVLAQQARMRHAGR